MTTQTETSAKTAPVMPNRLGSGFHNPTRKGVRFTVKQYLRMDRAGLFDDGRVELLLGRIYPMHAQANRHQWAITKGTCKLLQLFPLETHYVVIQGTLILDKHGAPEPDLHVFDVPAGTEAAQRPLPFLLIEVSDTTYRHDRGVKLVQYASAGVADYWIVNIPARRIEVYRNPDPRVGKDGGWGYAESTQFVAGQSITLLARRDVSIAVTDILP